MLQCIYKRQPLLPSLMLVAEKPDPKTAFLAGRPQRNVSYRSSVRIIVAVS